MAHVCQSGGVATCTDAIQDGTETDVDCGGATCPVCSVGKKCKIDADCTSNACDAVSLICVAAQCADHLKDGTETDVDCGGGTCPSCAVGKQCKVSADCTSNDCVANVCQSGTAGTCTDGAQDGTETDVDCGGGTCAPCPVGKKCQISADCASNACDANTLTCVATQCSDHLKDGNETDVDCGGGTCPPCAVGQQCKVNSDCTSGDCVANVCHSGTAGSCTDGFMDGTETDVDCGGGTCPTCSLGKKCVIDADCVSNACDAITFICVANQCADHRKDGNETDVDCGGGTCASCSVGKKCKVNSDCTSNACDAISAICVASQCADNLKDGNETDVDCGGGTCATCVTGKQCLVNADCTTNHCSANVCQ